jgi:hypothetical protein
VVVDKNDREIGQNEHDKADGPEDKAKHDHAFPLDRLVPRVAATPVRFLQISGELFDYPSRAVDNEKYWREKRGHKVKPVHGQEQAVKLFRLVHGRNSAKTNIRISEG